MAEALPQKKKAPGLLWRVWAEFTFAWVDPLFKLGGAVKATDLPRLEPADMAAVLAAGLSFEWQRELGGAPARRPSLARAIIRWIGPTYAVAALPGAVQSAAKIAQTQFLGMLVAWCDAPHLVECPAA